MRSMIDIFATLGDRLKNFGKDNTSLEVIHRAMEDNSWFSTDDILQAVDAVRQEFLDPEKLLCWSSAYTKTTPRRVAIIMAGNIPLVGFYDLLCVLMAGHRALVKPSSKDKVLTEYIISQLRDIDPLIAIEPYSEECDIDMVIATGGDQAARHFQSQYNNIPALIRGSRHSVAILSGKESKSEIEGLSRDIFSYNSLGCRSISLIFLPAGCQLSLSTPKISPMMHGNYAHNKALKTMLGIPFTDLGGYIAVENDSFPSEISQINYCYYNAVRNIP